MLNIKSDAYNAYKRTGIDIKSIATTISADGSNHASIPEKFVMKGDWLNCVLKRE